MWWGCVVPDRTKNRSDKYQYLLVESPCSPEMLTEFADSEGVTSIYSKYNEELLDLREQLKKEFWRLVDENLTERQKEVLHLYAEGNTQIEIAKKLNVNQSSITKSINGNCDYSRGNDSRVYYGGSIRRIKKLAAQDSKIQEILKKMAELGSDDD